MNFLQTNDNLFYCTSLETNCPWVFQWFDITPSVGITGRVMMSHIKFAWRLMWRDISNQSSGMTWLLDVTSFPKSDGWRHDLYVSGAALNWRNNKIITMLQGWIVAVNKGTTYPGTNSLGIKVQSQWCVIAYLTPGCPMSIAPVHLYLLLHSGVR
jgi:hypothetical protein